MPDVLTVKFFTLLPQGILFCFSSPAYVVSCNTASGLLTVCGGCQTDEDNSRLWTAETTFQCVVPGVSLSNPELGALHLPILLSGQKRILNKTRYIPFGTMLSKGVTTEGLVRLKQQLLQAALRTMQNLVRLTAHNLDELRIRV